MVIAGLHVGDYQDALAELIGPRRHTLLVLCAEEHQPPGAVPPFTVCVPLVDDGEPPGRELLDQAQWAARRVAEQVDTGGSCLVTCAMGLNRSGLVASLALLELGYDADQAIGLLRAARGPLALRNEAFEAIVRGKKARGPA